MPAATCRVTAKLLRVDNETVCCEFSRAEGSSWYFFDKIKELKEKLKDVSE